MRTCKYLRNHHPMTCYISSIYRLFHYSTALDINKYSCQFNVSSYAMAKNVPKMFDLLLETVSNTNFGDYARLKTIVLNSASSMIGSIADAGHAYATSYASASLSQAMVMASRYGST